MTEGAGGWAALGRGLHVEVPLSFVGRMTYFAVYELAKRQLGLPPSHRSVHDSQQPSEYVEPGTGAHLWRSVLAAQCASAIGWVVIFPFDVTKNRLQAAVVAAGAEAAQRRTFTGCWAHTYRTLGVAGFWTGFALTVVRSSLVSSVSLPLFDVVRPWLRSRVVGPAGMSHER